MAYEQVGSWAFILGVLIAIIVGLLGAAAVLDATTLGYVEIVLVILGFVVGFVNIAADELNDFLTAAIALLLVAAAATVGGLVLIPYIGIYLAGMVSEIALFVAPAALIVSLKAIFNMARSA